MAETLGVGQMLPNRYESKRKFRWLLAIDGIDSFLVKGTARPQIEISSQEIHWINTVRYVAGKAKFQPISITLYDPIAPLAVIALPPIVTPS